MRLRLIMAAMAAASAAHAQPAPTRFIECQPSAPEGERRTPNSTILVGFSSATPVSVVWRTQQNTTNGVDVRPVPFRRGAYFAFEIWEPTRADPTADATFTLMTEQATGVFRLETFTRSSGANRALMEAVILTCPPP